MTRGSGLGGLAAVGKKVFFWRESPSVPNGPHHNEFTPGEPTGATQCVRYIPDSSGSWIETPARPHGDCIWVAWNGKNVRLRLT
jgi:hypothetical protein